MSNSENPIKIVSTNGSDHRPPQPFGGGGSKVFGDGATTALRRTLSSQVGDLGSYFSASFQQWPNIPVVAKVTLVDEALAKSHRPQSLFSATSCPIIGSLDYGELLVSATTEGLNTLSNRIMKSDSKANIANISAIKCIEPYTEEERISGATAESLSRAIQEKHPLKLKLFNHQKGSSNDNLKEAFHVLSNELSMSSEILDYGDDDMLLETVITNESTLEKVIGFCGLRSVSPMPSYSQRGVSPQAQPAGELDRALCPPPDPSLDYPVVGIIDSGVCPATTYLQPWIVARESYVPPTEEDYAHGTMVAGLIANSRSLNHNGNDFPNSQAKIVDVNVFPRGGQSVSESDLVAIISEVIPKYPEVKVWNLSLGGSQPVSPFEFSDFSRALDKLHDKYGVLFVVAAGNQNDNTLWPTNNNKAENRISSPADSIRGLTVGSIAHKFSNTTVSRRMETSPFSRIGPGPCFIPKPELVHCGGNVTATGSFSQVGVLSAGPNNKLFENIGTSFASPIVAAMAAQLELELANSGEPAIPTERLKALLIHSAILRSNELVSSDTINYYGFGLPGDTSESLYCDDHSITLAFEADVRHGGFEFEKFPFPIPACLITPDRKFQGEILMTLAYSPITNSSFSSEYCRTNVEVGMGSYDLDDSGERAFNSKVPSAPGDVRKLYEKAQIENGFKWSPIKVYHKKFPRGTSVDTWRLKMKVTRRAEQLIPETPQPATLLLTIRSLDDEAPVYNDMVVAMNNAGWSTVDIDQHIRARTSI